MLGRGNFGAAPNPPSRASNDLRKAKNADSIACCTSPPRSAPASLYCRSCWMTCDPDCSIFLAILLPGARQAFEKSPKARASIASIGREICAPEKWLSFWGEPYRHGPSATARRRLYEQHVDAVDVRPFLTVYL